MFSYALPDGNSSVVGLVERLLAAVSAFSQENGRNSVDGELLYKLAEKLIAEGVLVDGQQLIVTALGTSGFANAVALSPDGSRWAIGAGAEAAIVEVGTGRVLAKAEFEARRIYALEWGSEGRNLFMGADDSLFRVLDPETLEAVLTLDGHSNYIKSLAVDRRTDTVFTVSGDFSLRLWDQRTAARIHSGR